MKCWHVKGKDHALLYVNSNCKEKMTVVAGVRTDGLSLQLIKNFSENSWKTKETFIDYIIGIRS